MKDKVNKKTPSGIIKPFLVNYFGPDPPAFGGIIGIFEITPSNGRRKSI